MEKEEVDDANLDAKEALSREGVVEPLPLMDLQKNLLKQTI